VARNSTRAAVLQNDLREDLRYGVETDRNIAIWFLDLVEAIVQNPFLGIENPESLRYVLDGCW
jgi:toxin YoeB